MKTLTNLAGLALLLLLVLALAASLKVGWAGLTKLQVPWQVMLTDLTATFARVSGVALACWLSGMLLGRLFFRYKLLANLLIPVFDYIRHISPFAWLPFAIIWLGLGQAPLLFILAVTLGFPAVVFSCEIFAGIPAPWQEEAHINGAGFWQTLWLVELPLTLTQQLNLLRLLWGLGWSTAIAAEMLGGSNGLGFRLLDLRYLLNYPGMLHYMLLMGGLGILVNIGLQKLINNLRHKY